VGDSPSSEPAQPCHQGDRYWNKEGERAAVVVNYCPQGWPISFGIGKDLKHLGSMKDVSLGVIIHELSPNLSIQLLDQLHIHS
jgi:hypothetical protein